MTEDRTTVHAVALLALAFVLAGMARSLHAMGLAPLGGFPLPGDNIPMAAISAIAFGAAWAWPGACQRLAVSARGRAAACAVALAGCACLALVGVLSGGAQMAVGRGGSLLTRLASIMLLVDLAALEAHRGVSWSVAFVALGFAGAVAIDVGALLLSPLGVAVVTLLVPVACWFLLRSVQRDRHGELLEFGRRALDTSTLPGHSLQASVVLFGLYGLLGGMSSSQSHSIAVGSAWAPITLAQGSLLNDVGLALGVALLVCGVAAIAARGVSPMPLRIVTLPMFFLSIFLAPLLGPSSGVIIPVLVAVTQVVLNGLLWLFPQVIGRSPAVRWYAAVNCSFYACTFVGMWFGGDVLPVYAGGGIYMIVAAVLISAVLLMELVPLLFGQARGTTGETVEAPSATAVRGAHDAPAPDNAAADQEPIAQAPSFAQVIDVAARRWGLTPREQAVLPGLARGRSMARIADALVVSKNTVHTHVRNIYAKAGVHSQEELMDAIEGVAQELGARVEHLA